MSRTIANTYTSEIMLSSGDSPLTITNTGLISNDSGALYTPGGPGQTWTFINVGSITALTSDAGMMVADRSTLAPGTPAPRAADARHANRAGAGAA
jgi:hypothetical protein